MTVKRYDIYANNPTIERQRSNEVEHLAGKWVLYADHLTAMQREREVRAKLVAELANIVTADYRAWDDGLNNPQEFVKWSKSRAVAALAAAKEIE